MAKFVVILDKYQTQGSPFDEAKKVGQIQVEIPVPFNDKEFPFFVRFEKV